MRPNSYTGQDTAELQVPGNPALLDRLLHAAIDAGARLRRAGRIHLPPASPASSTSHPGRGITATINATSEGQLKAPRHLCDGELGAFARSLVDDLGTRLALVEAGIDFTDQEDVVPIGPAELDNYLTDAEARLNSLLTNELVVGRGRSVHPGSSSSARPAPARARSSRPARPGTRRHRPDARHDPRRAL
ncbi:MAG: hypothetical protein R3C45_07350 [Phycisphaerales bacterium]